MLTLLLLRHAKTETAGRGDDFDRVLTEKGERDAGEVGQFLSEYGLVPTIALVSSAARTSRTFDLVAGQLGSEFELHREAVLYNAGVSRLCERVARIDSSHRVALVVAHNPGIMEAAVALALEGDLTEIDRLRGRFPPGGLAVLSFESEDWAAACASGGRLDALVFPEDLSG